MPPQIKQIIFFPRCGDKLSLATITLVAAAPSVTNLCSVKFNLITCTGNKFTVAVQIRNKYRPWLDAMIERFESEYDKKAVLLFGNTFSERNTVIARIINQSLDNHFGIEGKNYGLTSIRKVWETAKAKDESIKN